MTLGLEVVAEGVETEAALQEISQRGITLVQGYLFSPPRPYESFVGLVERVHGGAPSRYVSPSEQMSAAGVVRGSLLHERSRPFDGVLGAEDRSAQLGFQGHSLTFG